MKVRWCIGLLAMILLVTSAGSLFAAGQKQAAAGGQIEIRFAWWGDTARHEKYNAIADIFEQRNQGVKIIREFGGWADYWTRLATQTAGGNAPDVHGQHLRQVSDYARRGALLPLDSYIQSGVIDLSQFPASIREIGRLDGKTLMVAQGYTLIGTFYNAAILDQLGVPRPEFRWTWDQYRSTLAAIRRANPAAGFWPSVDMSGEESRLIVYLTQRGKQMFNQQGQIGFDVADITAWFELWDGLRRERLVPDGATTQEYSGVPLEQSMFVRRVTAMASIPFNQLTLFDRALGGQEIGLSLFPRMPNGIVGEELGASFLSIASTSRNPNVAARFINFFVNDKDAVSIFRLEQGALGSTASNAVITPLLNPIEQKLLAAIQRGADDVAMHPLPPAGAARVYSALQDAAQAVRFGQLTARQAAEQFVARARQSLAN